VADLLESSPAIEKITGGHPLHITEEKEVALISFSVRLRGKRGEAEIRITKNGTLRRVSIRGHTTFPTKSAIKLQCCGSGSGIQCPHGPLDPGPGKKNQKN
jgi:hypothetical protein